MHVAILEGSQASSCLEYFEAEVSTTDLSFPHSSSNSTSLLSNLLYVYMSPNVSSSQLHVFIFFKVENRKGRFIQCGQRGKKDRETQQPFLSRS